MSYVFALDIALLVLVVVCGVTVIRLNSLFAATMLAGLYSLLMALVWSNMHALDVGFTEASVGAGISTVLLLGALTAVGRRARGKDLGVDWIALAVCIATGAVLVYGTLDMPPFGDPDAPIHHRRVPKLLEQRVGKIDGHFALTPADASPEHGAHGEDHGDDHGEDHAGGHAHPSDDFNGHVPNTVTTLLAAYRGYDTMFETTVIFTAGITMVMLLRRRREDDPLFVEAARGTGERPDDLPPDPGAHASAPPSEIATQRVAMQPTTPPAPTTHPTDPRPSDVPTERAVPAFNIDALFEPGGEDKAQT